jgi:transaldolase
MSQFITKIFADGADIAGMLEMNADPMISGLTTNPTLMKKAGISDYEKFAKDVLTSVTEKPISFEVFSDDFTDMERQALKIAAWGENVYVKIPITNTKGESAAPLVKRLSEQGVKTNVTAMMTLEQTDQILPALAASPAAYISIFAGRIADTGVDPLPVMSAAMDRLKAFPKVELIWASPREVFNLAQANSIGCHVITMTNDLIKKIPTFGKNLSEFSLDTVKMFYKDASAAGFSL